MTDNLPAIANTGGVAAYRSSTEAASLCKEIVVATAMTIQDRRYVKVEGWQALAVAHGCVASSRDVERIEGGVRAIGEIRRMSDGALIATAEGFVGEDEPTWYGGEVHTRYGKKTLPKRPDYAIRAMAQTRAISRACRTAFAHVVVMMDAGLETTPAEEMIGVMRDEPVNDVSRETSAPAARKSSAQSKRDGDWDKLIAELEAQPTEEALKAWVAANQTRLDDMPVAWRDPLKDRYQLHKEALRARDREAAEKALDAKFDPRTGELMADEDDDLQDDDLQDDDFPGDRPLKSAAAHA